MEKTCSACGQLFRPAFVFQHGNLAVFQSADPTPLGSGPIQSFIEKQLQQLLDIAGFCHGLHGGVQAFNTLAGSPICGCVLQNLGVLLDAFERMRGDYDGSLVIVGKVGWKSEDIVPRLRGERVVHLDYVDAPRLATVFRDAEAFVMPSIYEGFGFPLLEAMHHGVPSIAARSSSLPEIGGDAALYFDPRDAGQLASLMQRVLDDRALRESLAQRGRARAAEFRWDRAAEQTLAVLRSVSS